MHTHTVLINTEKPHIELVDIITELRSSIDTVAGDHQDNGGLSGQ